MLIERKFKIHWILIVLTIGTKAQSNLEYGCPPQEKILPCRCSTRDMEFQIWCSHSELPKVLEGLKAVSHYVSRPVDELILENNNLPSLPGKVFASLRVLRLMLRNNRLERVSSGWLEGLHDSLLELYIVEPDLRSLPNDCLENLQGLEAVTLQSRLVKRLPKFSALPKLRYLQINSPALLELTPRNFRDLSNLEELHIFGSPRLIRLEAGLFRGMPRLNTINITDCGIHWVHPRALIDLPELKRVFLIGNSIVDAGMVGRALVDLPGLTSVHLDENRISRLAEASFVDLPLITRLHLSRNHITEIFAGAFQRLPNLKVLDLNHNLIHRIHEEFFPRRMNSGTIGLEEIWLINNDISHVGELRAVLDSLPRLKVLDASYNQLEEIPFGALRGHSTLERLHLDHNRLIFLQRETFTAMPALRELRLKNNSLTDSSEAPFWNLPALKGLDLSENYFRHVDSRLLKHLPSLRRLDLSGNSIALIEPDSFMNNLALEHINVSRNALSVLHPMTFVRLINLYELDVGWNRLLEIVSGLPRNLEHLHLSMNRIIAFPPVASRDLSLPMLRSLDLSANGIERIQPGVMSHLGNLRKLHFGYNALRVLEDGIFEALSRLEQIDFKYNRLVTIHGRSLRPLKSLMDLNLRGNRLEVLRPDLFQENIRLERLDLSRNNLAQIPHATFVNTRDLRELYASHNTLTELPGSLHGLNALQVLDLSFNKLNVLSPDTLSSLSSLLELRLVRNRIRELREGAFDGLPRLTLIDLEHNDLRVIERNAIKSLSELQAVKLGGNHLQIIPSGAFSELPLLQSAELQENEIQEIARNAFINVPHLLSLNLSHNNLPNLEYASLDSVKSLEILDLNNNRLSKVSSDGLASMEWLVELRLDNNRICTVQGSPFDDMPRLRVLSLRNNRMASVSENAFKRLRSNIAVLDIDGNPLSCTCGMLWLRGWLQQQGSSDGPRCADGSFFKEVRLSRQDCQRERFVEPFYPGCESEMTNLTNLAGPNTIPPWMNLQDLSTNKPSHENDYLYNDYLDYYQENTGENGVSFNSTTSSSTIVSSTFVPSTTMSFPTNKTSFPNKMIPASPSSSGFTFFGVPLPSLNFNLWGNSGRKTDRREDSYETTKGRYRMFPPTEPEIHRGGFIPLPRGQGGFLPIIDPNSTVRSKPEGRKRTKGNATISKIDKPQVSKGDKFNRSTNFKDREELSTVVVNDTTVRANEPYQQADETSVSTEIYGGDSLEAKEDKIMTRGSIKVSSKIVWTTPASEVETTEMINNLINKISTTTVYDSMSKIINVITRFERNGSISMCTDLKLRKISDLERLSKSTTDYPKSSTTMRDFTSSQQPIKVLEASALSALLVPGGQISSSVTTNGIRPLRKSTIVKVPSPRSNFPDEHQSTAVKAEAVKKTEENNSNNSGDDVFDDNYFNWYFQRYNDTNEGTLLHQASSSVVTNLDFGIWILLLFLSSF